MVKSASSSESDVDCYVISRELLNLFSAYEGDQNPHTGGPVEHMGLWFEVNWPHGCAGFFLGLLFDPEDGNDMFLRIVGLWPNYTAS
jgi:hypothetical protein